MLQLQREKGALGEREKVLCERQMHSVLYDSPKCRESFDLQAVSRDVTSIDNSVTKIKCLANDCSYIAG